MAARRYSANMRGERRGRRASRSAAEFERAILNRAVHAILVDIIDAWPKVLKTDNAGRSTAPQKGPIRSNLRGVFYWARSNGSRRSSFEISPLRSSFLPPPTTSPIHSPLPDRGEEPSIVVRRKSVNFFIADIGAYVAIKPHRFPAQISIALRSVSPRLRVVSIVSRVSRACYIGCERRHGQTEAPPPGR